MGGQIGSLIVTTGLFALIGAAIVLSWPLRRERTFTFRRLIGAPRDRVWGAYRINPDNLDSAAFHASVVDVRTVEGEPAMREYVFDSSSGHGTHRTTVRSETLAERPPEYCETRICEIDGKPFPFGDREIETLELREGPDGTQATLTWRGETATLWQFLAMWHGVGRFMRRLRQFCETDAPAEPSAASAGRRRFGRSFWTSLIVSAVAVGSFAMWLGWIGALILAGVLVVHEFGHWLAMRATGQPAPRMMLVPFLGGVAVCNHPHKSLFDEAFCSLMGAGFSALLSLGFLAAGFLLDPPGLWDVMAVGAHASSVWQILGLGAAALAIAVGVINLIQLLPVLPLDGGQVLRAVLQSFGAGSARWILLMITGLGIAAFAYTGDFLLAGILGLGALQAWHMGRDAPQARRMGASAIFVISAGYGLTLAVHLAAVLYGGQIIGVDFARLVSA